MAEMRRCPSCGAAVRPGAAWCPQCYAELPGASPAAPAPPAPPATPATPATPPTLGPPTAPATAAPASTPDTPRRARHRAPDEDDDTPPPGWPCPRCGTVNALAATTCSSCGRGFLEELTEDRGVPAVAALTGLSRGARLGVALGAVVLFLAILVLLVWLTG